MFSVFSNRAYATLVGVQFLVQAGQGVIQGAFAKSIAFGGEKGFDVTVVPSAQYLLKVVLALYVPYTLVSPFIGVGIDRFERRRILSLSNIVTAAVVSIVAVAVMLPLGKETSEGNVGATVALDRRAVVHPGMHACGARRQVGGDPRRACRARTCSRATVSRRRAGRSSR